MTTENHRTWSREAWDASLPVLEAIKQLPFIREMADGSEKTTTRS